MKHTVRVSKNYLFKYLKDHKVSTSPYDFLEKLPDFITLEAELVSEGCCDSCRNTHEFHKRSGLIPCICPCHTPTEEKAQPHWGDEVINQADAPCDHKWVERTSDDPYRCYLCGAVKLLEKPPVIQELVGIPHNHTPREIMEKLNEVIRAVNHLTNPPQPL